MRERIGGVLDLAAASDDEVARQLIGNVIDLVELPHVAKTIEGVDPREVSRRLVVGKGGSCRYRKVQVQKE